MISLLQILSEIKNLGTPFEDPKWVIKTKEFMDRLESSPELDIHIGKYDVAKGQKGFEYTWDDAISRKGIISSPTRKFAEGVFNILGYNPEKVYNGWYIYDGPVFAKSIIKDEYGYNKLLPITSKHTNNKSTYITGHYNTIPVIVAQRQTKDTRAGQMYIFSPYAKLYNTGTRDPKKRTPPSDVDWNTYSKEELLRKLKIPQ